MPFNGRETRQRKMQKKISSSVSMAWAKVNDPDVEERLNFSDMFPLFSAGAAPLLLLFDRVPKATLISSKWRQQ